MAAKKKETIQQEAPEVTAAPAPAQTGTFCKTCERLHAANLDGPGVGHWKFEIGSDAEAMFNYLCAQPKISFFIPLSHDEKFGSLATPIRNGLKIGIYKGAFVDLPRPLAEQLQESMNVTQRLTSEAKTAPNPQTGHIQPARLDLRPETDRTMLDA